MIGTSRVHGFETIAGDNVVQCYDPSPRAVENEAVLPDQRCAPLARVSPVRFA
jgi:hypothetical protein